MFRVEQLDTFGDPDAVGGNHASHAHLIPYLDVSVNLGPVGGVKANARDRPRAEALHDADELEAIAFWRDKINRRRQPRPVFLDHPFHRHGVAWYEIAIERGVRVDRDLDARDDPDIIVDAG